MAYKIIIYETYSCLRKYIYFSDLENYIKVKDIICGKKYKIIKIPNTIEIYNKILLWINYYDDDHFLMNNDICIDDDDIRYCLPKNEINKINKVFVNGRYIKIYNENMLIKLINIMLNKKMENFYIVSLYTIYLKSIDYSLFHTLYIIYFIYNNEYYYILLHKVVAIFSDSNTYGITSQNIYNILQPKFKFDNYQTPSILCCYNNDNNDITEPGNSVFNDFCKNMNNFRIDKNMIKYCIYNKITISEIHDRINFVSDFTILINRCEIRIPKILLITDIK